MRVEWASEAFDDLHRLHTCLASKNPRAADRAIVALLEAPVRLLTMPRAGAPVVTFTDHEIRRIFVAQYELRYEVVGDVIRILRIFHAREDR